MRDITSKLIKFAKDSDFTKDEWISAIDHLYAAQTDFNLEKNGKSIQEHIVTMNDSRLIITSERELLN